MVLQLGVVPGRVDILTELTGHAFEEARPDRVRHGFGPVTVDVIGRDSCVGVICQDPGGGSPLLLMRPNQESRRGCSQRRSK